MMKPMVGLLTGLALAASCGAVAGGALLDSFTFKPVILLQRGLFINEFNHPFCPVVHGLPDVLLLFCKGEIVVRHDQKDSGSQLKGGYILLILSVLYFIVQILFQTSDVLFIFMFDAYLLPQYADFQTHF